MSVLRKNMIFFILLLTTVFVLVSLDGILPHINIGNFAIDNNTSFDNKKYNYTTMKLDEINLNITRSSTKSRKIDPNFFAIEEWGPISGEWEIKDKWITEKGSTPWAFFILNRTFNNFTLDAKIYPESSTDAGIVFRWKNSGNFYITDLWGGLRLSLGKDQEYSSISERSLTTPLNEWYKIKIIASGDNIKIYKDNLLQIETNDSTFSEGKIGFKTYNARARFSDIRIARLTNRIVNISLNYNIKTVGLSNISLLPSLVENVTNPSGASTYNELHEFSSRNYSVNGRIFDVSDSLSLNFNEYLIYPPDVIYFAAKEHNPSVYTIRLIARGWDDQKQEWVFKEFMSPEFTWEDVVEGRTIAADGSRQ